MIKDKYSRQRYEVRKASNLCVLCGKPLDREGVVCTACNSKRTAYGRELYKKLQAVGVCPRCGKNLLYGDEKSCVECKAKSAEAASKKRGKSLEEVSQRLLISKTTTSRRVADIKEKIERSQAMINKVPIWEKVTLTIDEAAEYSNIGINRINDMLNNPSCPFVLFVGRGKRLVKRKEFEKYLEKTDSI